MSSFTRHLSQRTPSLLVLAAALAFAAPASAQVTAIVAGQTISGRLDTSDGRLQDDSYFDLYEYRGQGVGEGVF